ncbi:MAG TPA: hypothetical protein PLD59_08375 [Tepidisphaeraceae bacterium]|nr:hypothetical protein [Tepidisphaeraceae bacterium]
MNRIAAYRLDASRFARRAAAGKALLVWLFSGSLGIALLAFVLFKLIGW